MMEYVPSLRLSICRYNIVYGGLKSAATICFEPNGSSFHAIWQNPHHFGQFGLYKLLSMVEVIVGVTAD